MAGPTTAQTCGNLSVGRTCEYLASRYATCVSDTDSGEAWKKIKPYAACIYDLGATTDIWGLGCAQVRIMEAPERFQLVSSLYGEGTVLAWFFIVASTFDSVSNDFIAALTMPVVAPRGTASTWSSATGSSRGGGGETVGLLTSWTTGSVQLAAALEAPLTICENFVVMALVLFGVATYRGYSKRAFSVLAAGLLSLSPSLVLFPQYIGIPLINFNFNRTFNVRGDTCHAGRDHGGGPRVGHLRL
ncbi:hypothetical protein N658DRAFT_485552 [Parathielavia hyrcaniae]|uniref:Uncharacterized protein n=1 Tax=Parathielavia hyrcaniae TaxID=113614 RepID=A0AAN6T2U0_9PEZI|nr:hypothetical protein N658DRAFT_485552 [Parathielavia hyrcaniae]